MGEEKSNVVITEEGALSVKKLTFWEAAMIIVGANIGAGILGLAYSSRKAGWPILLMWLIIAGVFTTVSMLYVAETTLRTKKPMQLPGLAERYVGKLGAVLVFISVCANSIGCIFRMQHNIRIDINKQHTEGNRSKKQRFKSLGYSQVEK